MLALAALAGCMWSGNADEGYPVRVYVAETMKLSDLRSSVKVTGPTQLQSPGKIYVLGNFLFVNELRKGVHIYDNTDPQNPKNLSFVAVPGSTDMAAKGNALYIDNAIDLVTLDITNEGAPTIAGRIENALPSIAPTDRELIYGDFNPNTDVIINWKDTTIYRRAQ
jgi:hypothetical protein